MKKNASSLFAHRKGAASTQDRIFRILVDAHPLTIGALKEALIQEFRISLSYQAVRKAVGVLLGSGIVERTSSGYQLSTKWLLDMRGIVDEALHRYSSGAIHLRKGEAYQRFETSSLHETDTLWGEILMQLCKSISRDERSEIISINHYPWWLPLNLGREEALWNEIRKLGWTIRFIFTEKIPSARWAEEIYKGMNIPVSFGLKSPIEKHTYYNVFGGHIIRATLPAVLEQKIAKCFAISGKRSSLSPARLRELGSLRGAIVLEVFQSTVFAESLRKLEKLP